MNPLTVDYLNGRPYGNASSVLRDGSTSSASTFTGFEDLDTTVFALVRSIDNTTSLVSLPPLVDLAFSQSPISIRWCFMTPIAPLLSFVGALPQTFLLVYYCFWFHL
jgi:hypothetical protein